MASDPVLIAGAGPTGLVLALALARRGVEVRIISAADGPGEHSRAMVVHARTLEFYRQFGFADEVVAAGIPVRNARLREGGGANEAGRALLTVSFADLGRGLTPFPTPLVYPQDDHERFLIDQLAVCGVAVEWQTRLVSFVQDEQQVAVQLEHGDGRREAATTPFVCGCDGARSVVRHALDVGFPGGTYEQLYYVVDCALDGGFERDLIVNLGTQTFALLLPVRSRGVQRLIGLVPPQIPQRDDLSFDDLRAAVEPLIGRRVSAVSWFSTYRVHHRVAERFRTGRAFLLGDAAHVHSPAGGQGMNTGIGDAVNLGWKLAMVQQGRAPASLLDSYEAERIAFARTLVATTDRAFTPMVASGIIGHVMRRFLLPTMFAAGTRLGAGRRAFFRLVSQTQIEYEDSEVSEGGAGRIEAGDRLPWVADLDNFAALASLDWQVHLYGAAPSEDLTATGARLRLPLHAFPGTADAKDAHLSPDGLYLVRPDGHVGYAGERANHAGLEAYWQRHGFRSAPG